MATTWAPFPCVFCGRVPEALPHWCLLEKRQREEETLLAAAYDAERRQTEQRELHRTFDRIYGLERRYNDLVRGETLARMPDLIQKAEG